MRIGGKTNGDTYNYLRVLNEGAVATAKGIALPFIASASHADLAAAASAAVTVPVPAGGHVLVKKVATTATATVNSIEFDGVDTGVAAGAGAKIDDTATLFGDCPVIGDGVEVSFTNGTGGALTCTVTVTGLLFK